MSDLSDEAIINAVRQVLSECGPLDEDDLLDELATRGIDMLDPEAEDMFAEILESDTGPVLLLVDGRWVWLPDLLDGRVFTHRLSATEVDHDLIELGVDLAPLSMLTEVDTYQRLSDGSPITEVFPHHDEQLLAERGVGAEAIDSVSVLLLPRGSYAAMGCSADELIGVRATGNGFAFEKVGEPPLSKVGVALAELLVEHGQPEMLDAAVWTVCADDDSAFRAPTTPLGELLPDAGLARDGDWFAADDFDFGAWRMAGQLKRIAEQFNLDGNEAVAVLAITHFLDQPAPQPDSPDGEAARDMLSWLAQPAVAAAVLGEIDIESAAALGRFAESMEPLAPRAARPALRWLLAMAQEELGEILQAESSLEAAQAMDPSWPLTLVALARYASDRGEAERGLDLLRQADTPDDDNLVVLLEHFRPAPRPGLGRNERCWCGSGRKYKVCHLNREQLPLEERAAWLYQKAGLTLLDGGFVAQLLDLAHLRAQYRDAPLEQVLHDGLVWDALLFEGGAFAHFLATRGVLLPDDERSLAERWLSTQRSVHEVLEVARGHGMTLRDIRTGDVHQVRERAGSAGVDVGEFYCARAVPAGDTWQVFGGLEPVAPAERDELVALLDRGPDPVELVMALSA